MGVGPPTATSAMRGRLCAAHRWSSATARSGTLKRPPVQVRKRHNLYLYFGADFGGLFKFHLPPNLLVWFSVGPISVELSGPATLESTAGHYECRTSGADPPAHLTWTLLDRTGADLTHLLQVESGEHMYYTRHSFCLLLYSSFVTLSH